MRIGKPHLLERDGQSAYRVAVDSAHGIGELWFGVEPRFGDLMTDRSEAALLGLVLPAMLRGQDIHLEGTISGRALHNLSGPFQSVLASVIPELRKVRIHAEVVAAPPRPAAGVATGFSAGIDSFSVLADHHYGDPPPGYRLTHLLYNNVGSHGPAGNPVFRARYERLKPVADRMGLPFVAVDSNLMSFYEGLGFKLTYTVRNAVVALLLQAGIGRSLHAAGTILERTHTGPANDVAFSDPVVLPMVSTEALDAVSVGGVYTRVQKTLQVAEIEETYGVLDVCVRNDRAGNCSTCKKCVRTILTLELAGLLDRYAAVFDVPAYRKARRWRMARILRGEYQNALEVKALARERGYSFPIGERAIARLRLDLVRAWLVGVMGRTRGGRRWIRERNVKRSPIWSSGA